PRHGAALGLEVADPRVRDGAVAPADVGGRDADGLADVRGEVGLVGADAAVLEDVAEGEAGDGDLLGRLAAEVVDVVLDVEEALADLAVPLVLALGPGHLVDGRG